MRIKLIVCLAAMSLCASSYTNAANESPNQQKTIINIVPPDSLRIPSTISLLEETPFFFEPGNISATTTPTGILSAQEGIKVLGGEYKWARGRSWWKISTWLGPEWISPEPWNLDVPPPDKITLFSDTPIYATMDDSIAPSAVLSPQEVQVSGAEKQWFYANDSDEKHWVRIHTSWLGDQWVHLPVGGIGYVKPVDYSYYYDYSNGQYLLNDPNDYGPYASMAGPMFDLLQNETVHVVGEFVSVYDTSYQVETENGTRFVHERGFPVTRENDTITLKSDTPFYSAVGLRQGVSLVLHPQTLNSFEKFLSSNMYHVHTALGDGWINPDYSEPTDLKKTDISIDLHAPHTLFQFPRAGFELDGLKLSSGTIRPTASWIDPQGLIWYLLETKDGKAWLKQEQDSTSR